MRPIEILLGVLFPLLVAVGLAMAMGANSSMEFAIARFGFIGAAIDLGGLIVWWVYKHQHGNWQYVLVT